MADGTMSEMSGGSAAGPSVRGGGGVGAAGDDDAAVRVRDEGPGPADAGLVDADGAILPMAEIEARAIRLALRLNGGNLSEAARRLGIGRSTLYRKLAAMRDEAE